jgi:hypothetical protein
MNNSSKDKYNLTSSQVADLLKVKRIKTIAKYRTLGLPCIKVGKRYYYNEDKALDWQVMYKSRFMIENKIKYFQELQRKEIENDKR